MKIGSRLILELVYDTATPPLALISKSSQTHTDRHHVSLRFLCITGESRAALKWADGKVIKNEVDLQVCWKGRILYLSSVAEFVELRFVLTV